MLTVENIAIVLFSESSGRYVGVCVLEYVALNSFSIIQAHIDMTASF